MASHYSNLEKLRQQKKETRKEIHELEDILTFKNKKESLGVFTHGFTDRFLKETHDDDGDTRLALDTENIMRQIADGIKESASKKNILNLASETVSSGLLENTIRIGAVSLVGNYAKKNVMNKKWKNKLIGLALIYLAPYVLKFIREKLDDYQKNKTTKSLEKLI